MRNTISHEIKDQRIIFSVSQTTKDKFVSESNLRGLSLSDFIRFCILKEISKSKGDFTKISSNEY